MGDVGSDEPERAEPVVPRVCPPALFVAEVADGFRVVVEALPCLSEADGGASVCSVLMPPEIVPFCVKDPVEPPPFESSNKSLPSTAPVPFDAFLSSVVRLCDASVAFVTPEALLLPESLQALKSITANKTSASVPNSRFT